jgi:signal transduction histidine kinase
MERLSSRIRLPAPLQTPVLLLAQRLHRLIVTIRAKLVLPYVVLTVVVALVGTLIATRLATASARERFYNQLNESARVTADGVVRRERAHLENLRLLVFTDGVAEAVAQRDLAALEELTLPLLLNNKVEVLSVLDAQGVELLTLARQPEAATYVRTTGTNLAGFAPVRRVLDGVSDLEGDKYAGLITTHLGAYLFTTAPVKRDGQLVGVMALGSRLDTLVAELKAQSQADVIVLDANGKFLATTLARPDEGYGLLEIEPQALSAAPSTLRSLQLYQRPYESLYAPLVIRREPVGMLAAVLPSQYIFDTQALSRNIIGVIFTFLTIAIIVLGFALAQYIVRPILRLRAISQAVAAGDLEQKTGLEQDDEIGELAGAFDTMTERLRERTRVAAQLYQETLLRNKELAAANAQLRAAQQQLIQSEKMAAIGQLTAGIVHDVKNPLAGAMGLAELMVDDDGVDESSRQNLSLIIENIKRANRIVGDLMKFARQSSLEMQCNDMRGTIETVLRLTGYMARQSKVELRADLPESPVMMNYDPQLIEQVLVNLVQNGIQAMPNGGPLVITLRQRDEMVTIAVRDSGTGIRPEHLNRIFDPFFTTKPAGVGTGLGLSVSYGIVSNHGGRIDVESALGEGTTFTVWLPVNPPLQPRAELAASTSLSRPIASGLGANGHSLNHLTSLRRTNSLSVAAAEVTKPISAGGGFVPGGGA